METASTDLVDPPNDHTAEPYEFGRPAQLDEGAVREVRELFEGFAVLLAEFWTQDLRTEPTIEIGDVSQVPADGLSEWIPESADLTVGAFPPVLGNALMAIPTNLALNMIDLLLGGGGGSESQPDRGLTAIEATMLNPVTLKVFELLGVTLAGPASRSRVVSSGPRRADFDLAGALGDSIGIEIKLTCGETTATILIGLSMDLATTLVSELAASLDDVDNSPSRELLMRSLATIDVELTVEFPPSTIRSADVLQMTVGDVIPLECRVGSPLLLTSSGALLGLVLPAHNGEHLAIQLHEFPVTDRGATL